MFTQGSQFALGQQQQFTPLQPSIGLPQFGPSPQATQVVQQFQQLLTQLEHTESRHAQMLQQIQADEQHAAEQLRQLRSLANQLIQFSQPNWQHQPQYQPATTTFPRV